MGPCCLFMLLFLLPLSVTRKDMRVPHINTHYHCKFVNCRVKTTKNRRMTPQGKTRRACGFCGFVNTPAWSNTAFTDAPAQIRPALKESRHCRGRADVTCTSSTSHWRAGRQRTRVRDRRRARRTRSLARRASRRRSSFGRAGSARSPRCSATGRDERERGRNRKGEGGDGGGKERARACVCVCTQREISSVCLRGLI